MSILRILFLLARMPRLLMFIFFFFSLDHVHVLLSRREKLLLITVCIDLKKNRAIIVKYA